MKHRRIRRLLWLLFAASGVLVLVLLPKIWGDLVYPLRYKEEILTAAKEFNLEPTLITGVIFTESHFNPRATSRVGARGLMQLMPGTAAGIANKLGDTSYTADKLYEPATNIRYGSYYLRSLLDRYGEVDVVLVGYNGGPGVANRYAVSRSAPIPQESAQFITKVKRARDAYTELYGADLSRAPADPSAPRSDLATKLKREDQPRSFWDQLFSWVFDK